MSSTKKIFIVAGEASGDLHASNLVKELSAMGSYTFEGMGGERMQEAGVHIYQHYREANFMGFVEVVKNLRTVLKKIKFVKDTIARLKPDVVVLVDFPAFNLRIAPWCKQLGIPVVYYISPQIWAWKQGRVKQIKAYVDTMMTILPFEKEFYKKFGVEVEYVGHPLLDALETYPYDTGFIQALKEKAAGRPVIGILPGSRRAEVQSKLPVMLRVAQKYKNEYYFVIAGAPGADHSLYNTEGFDIYFGQTYNILKASSGALVTSGTATLETALHRVPQVVCYRMNELNYQLAKRVVKVKYITLANLIMDKLVVTELIQNELNEKKLEEEFRKIMSDERERILKDYDELVHLLGDTGASKRAAQVIKKAWL